MKKILLIPGSFNPITNAHIEMAITAQNKVNADLIQFIPAHDTYVARKDTLIPGFVRCDLINDLPYKNIGALDIETYSYLPAKTYDTVSEIKSIRKNNEYYICLGMDNIKTLPTWNNWEKFIEENTFIACIRNNENLQETLTKYGLAKYKNHFIEVEISPNNTSSSLVRKLCANNEFDKVKELVPNNVYKYLLDFYEVIRCI